MGIRQLRPYTATTRTQSYINYREVLTTDTPYKPLLAAKPRKAGRNNTGRITVRHHGGGNKVKYRIIDWKRSRKDVEGVVTSVEYDPNRTAFISLVKFIDGDRRYVLATNGVKVGTKIIASQEADIKAGNSLPLKKIPAGTIIHSVEMRPGAGAKLVRSAGASATLVGRIEKYAQIRMPSGELRLIPEDCYATIGTVSNADHMNVSIGKAGRNRWKGVRPTVRGVAMNPVDHPMGGGEGRTSGGRHPCSPWGQLSKGYKTRKVKPSDKFIVSRRKK
ncbi:50S ribosomal protein L2 [Silvanigrella aquatica]|uniref:Large ribosomal subunit protein uL2 n=1 Tax=Silvanigrella aquatica TaxID=1915309 RepID=A0A1L4D2S5_9BACT|nr:50S ribosomal protein L2 [Silvanigrella aquatica]APJ04499.1 50S ribosomal protein L2 [Silvanigrella aquatica]